MKFFEYKVFHIGRREIQAEDVLGRKIKIIFYNRSNHLNCKINDIIKIEVNE